MKYPLFLFIVCLVIGLAPKAAAQPADTLSPKKIRIPSYIRYIDEGAFLDDTLTSAAPDTALSGLHLVNGAEKSFGCFLANSGSAATSSLFAQRATLYADGYLDSYADLLSTSADIRYFLANKRYSELYNYIGPRKDQAIRLIHSQNIRKNLSAGIDFSRWGATGYLQDGKTFKSSVRLFSWYHTKDNRYHLLAHAIWESVKNEVNGGTVNDSLYDLVDLSSRDLGGLTMHLQGAENHAWSRIYGLRQYLDLKRRAEPDTGLTFRYRPALRLGLENTYRRYAFSYIDGTSDSLFYTNTFYGDIGKDSLYTDEFLNTLRLSRFPGASGRPFSRLFLSAGVTARWMAYRQRSIEEIRRSATLLLEARTAQDSLPLSAGFRARQIVAGDENGNYEAEAWAGYRVGRTGLVRLSAATGRFAVPLYMERYYANHFIWEHSTRNMTMQTGSVLFGIASARLQLEAQVWSVKQLPYFDLEAVAAQWAPAVQVSRLGVKKDFTWRRLHFDNTLYFQHSGNDSILSLPSFSSYHAVYVAVRAFRSSLQFVTGADVRFQNRYSGADFMPASGFFYLQDSVQTSGYALVNIFFNFRIKTADLFLKIANAGYNIFTDGYYLVPHQPMQGRTFMFGIRWRFYDE
jgi:hypothetical protein